MKGVEKDAWKGRQCWMNPLDYIGHYYGLETQLDRVTEACSELIKAIKKHKRYSNEESLKDVLEGIADIEILTVQIKHLTRGTATVSEFKEYKINRQIDRIKGKEDVKKCS